MNREDLVLSQYKMYSEQKDKFIDRTFLTNRFYLVTVLVLFALSFIFSGFSIGKLTAPTVFCAFGMASCILWWLNMDSYNCLIKIKFSKVLEVIEKELPLQPFAMEYKAIKDYRNNKKGFLFSDIQKTFAILNFLTFFIMIMIECLPILVHPHI